MTHKLLRKELIGKKVLSEGGTELGTLDEIVIDDETGEIKYLLIRFTGKISPLHKTDSHGRVICAISDMRITEGHIVVN